MVASVGTRGRLRSRSAFFNASRMYDMRSALPPRGREQRHGLVSARHHQVQDRLLADDAVGLERSTLLKAHDAILELGIVDVGSDTRGRLSFDDREALAHPLDL